MTDPTASTAFKLHRATVLIDRLADDFLVREHGIHYSQFAVLLMVRVLGEPSQRSIAANLSVSRASITQRVTALVERGLLAVAPDPQDARANVVRFTPSGSALTERAWAGLEQHQSGLDDGVDESALAAQLDLLIANGMRTLGTAP
jgi:DNA-binding MarR family transcriptional regulator